MKRCADASFLIDVARADLEATKYVREMQQAGEPLRAPAPAVAELLLGALRRRGKAKLEALAFAEEIETLPVDYAVAAEAASIGSRLYAIGRPMPMVDLLIAATARQHKLVLITRDQAFSHVEGLTVEPY